MSGAAKTFFCYDGSGEFGQKCVDVCEATGCVRVETPRGATFAIAPKLTRKLVNGEWTGPELGTLIFHPSILPYHRGPDAIRWAVADGDRVSGVTWFWCDDGLDTGPICEQEPVVLKLGESPGRAYHTRFVPAGIRSLERAVAGIVAGHVRRVLQEHELASYESFWPAPAAACGCPGATLSSAS
jgi:hypothetical protein